MVNMSPAEIQLRTHISSETHYCQAIRTSAASNSFRTILALMMTLSVISNQDDSKHEMIVDVVPADNRPKTCYDLYQVCQETISRSGTCSAISHKKSILAHTTTDVDFATTPGCFYVGQQ
jgi:hypothetical protein